MPISIDDSTGNIFAGGEGTDGDLVLQNGSGQNRIRLDADGGNAWFGGNLADGDLVLFPASGDNSTLDQASIHLDGGGGNAWLGGNGTDGDLVLQSVNGQNRIRLDAGGGNAWFGGNGVDGDVVLFPASGDNETLAQATIHMDGQSGDIILQNADCAEDFDAADDGSVEPGTVVMLGDDGLVHASNGPYNKRVVGITAGAGGLKPGIILGRDRTRAGRLPVALIGRVYCKAQACNGAIEIGDLLTTSDTPGHVMKATDPFKAFGAVVGKALTGLASGTGLIQVLVALQ